MYKNEVGEIDVFCVGNRDYEGLEFWFPDAKLLAVQGSGVPELRRFCYGISERANMREAEQFVKVEVPDLLQSLRVWVEAAESDTSTPSIPENLIEQLRHVHHTTYCVGCLLIPCRSLTEARMMWLFILTMSSRTRFYSTGVTIPFHISVTRC